MDERIVFDKHIIVYEPISIKNLYDEDKYAFGEIAGNNL